MGEQLLVQQQWYDVTKARNQTTNGLKFDLGDVRRHQIRSGSAPSLGRSCVQRTGPYKLLDIMETAQDRLHDMGEKDFLPNVSQRLRAGPPTTETSSGGRENGE